MRSTEAELVKVEEAVLEVMAQTIEKHTAQYVDAQEEMQEKADPIKSYYRLLDADRYKMKADVELHEIAGEVVPPVDEELVVELEKGSVVGEGEFERSWSTADRLWKSEAVDTFNVKYFLLVFETKSEEEPVIRNEMVVSVGTVLKADKGVGNVSVEGMIVSCIY